jgi:hypothetical protein
LSINQLAHRTPYFTSTEFEVPVPAQAENAERITLANIQLQDESENAFVVHDELNRAVSPIASVYFARRENVKRSTRKVSEVSNLNISSSGIQTPSAGSFDEGKSAEETKS